RNAPGFFHGPGANRLILAGGAAPTLSRGAAGECGYTPACLPSRCRGLACQPAHSARRLRQGHRFRRVITSVAATNKSLARSNKSRTRGGGTKETTPTPTPPAPKGLVDTLHAISVPRPWPQSSRFALEGSPVGNGRGYEGIGKMTNYWRKLSNGVRITLILM